MKIIQIFALFLVACGLFFPSLPAQEVMEIKSGCNFAAADSLQTVYSYEASREALEIVERIMKMNVLPQNFIVRSADCNNAVATTAGKQRYILYSTHFLENFKKEAQTQWAAYSVLAHEVGHHLSNHNLDETDTWVRKRYELEADKFSGGVLYRMGATLEEAQAGINSFSLEGETNTHPAKRARLEALAVGWKQAESLAADAENATGVPTADSDEKKLYKQAVSEKDPYKAIELLDQAIELKEDYADAYLERGKRKVDIESVDEIRTDFEGAVADYTVYLQMRAKDPVAYAERGYAYRRLGRNDLAMADYNRAIRLDAKFADAYLGRAWVKMYDSDNEAALKDLEAATRIKPDFAVAHYWHGNIQYGYGEYEKAILDFDQALKADSTYLDALDLRAAACQFAGRFAEAIADLNRLQAMDPEQFTSYIGRGMCYQSLGKHREAITDFDAVVKKYPQSADGYLYRGLSYAVLGLKDKSKQDFDQVFENTVLRINSSVKIGCLLIEFGLPKEGLVWIDAILEESPENRQALECKAQALKK